MKKIYISVKRFLFLAPLIVVIFHFFVYSSHATAEVIIIANKEVPENTLPKEEIKRIFLGKKKKWRDNTPITIVLRKPDKIHQELLNTYVNRTSSQFLNVWKRMVFTGEAQYPRLFSNQDSLIDFVATHKGAVSYIDSDQLNINKVKIIKPEWTGKCIK